MAATAVKVNGVRVQEVDQEVLFVESTSKKGWWYKVDLKGKRCSCPAWIFSKNGADGHKPPCKHLKALREEI